MLTNLELPLVFAGHTARIVVRRLHRGGWHVRAEVDGRTLGWHEYAYWPQVEHFQQHMQEWLNHAEATEQPKRCAA